ncbi:Yippee/Mis18/Cereblon [Trinorchestia longiramus]|nr:Yippee/Mis18/Cereblon [Trinorchestia longiramus]
MGLIYCEDFGGKTVYCCGKCDVYLTHQCHLLSEDFVGASGPAHLFEKVYNITYGPSTKRQMITGGHYARDVHCKRCDAVLGWYYELADRPLQQWLVNVLEHNYIVTCQEERPSGRMGMPAISFQDHPYACPGTNIARLPSLNSLSQITDVGWVSSVPQAPSNPVLGKSPSDENGFPVISCTSGGTKEPAHTKFTQLPLKSHLSFQK